MTRRAISARPCSQELPAGTEITYDYRFSSERGRVLPEITRHVMQRSLSPRFLR